MRVRIGGNGDAAAAIGIVHHVLHEHGLPFEPRELDREVLAPDRVFKASGGAFFVAVDDEGRPVGTAGLLLTDPGAGEIRKLFVLPRARGRGVGRALLDAVLAAARERGLERLRLVTRGRYDRAIELYERVGFRRVDQAGTRRAGEPGLVFELRLDRSPAPEGRPAGLPPAIDVFLPAA
ncbi:MAG TPA: GNAT family N-acetyltransferase [Actinomycetes bacterium]|nr:GNAT family N-acetyltransferase [Actinomycetes bacterium]